MNNIFDRKTLRWFVNPHPLVIFASVTTNLNLDYDGDGGYGSFYKDDGRDWLWSVNEFNI